MNQLLSVWQNKHTSTAALVFFVCSAIGVLWPDLKEKMNEVASLAVAYGLLQAGDGSHTTALKKDLEELKSNTAQFNKPADPNKPTTV